MIKSNIYNADLGNGLYKNPILYCDYSDPDAIRVGDDYFMVASSFSNSPGLPLLHSKDLVNWKVVNYVIDKVPTDRYKKPVHGCGVWAPSIRYHEGVYYVCFPMPDEGIYMCTTTNPFGEWSEPVNIRPGAGWIDPCPFWDDDGKAYLVAGVAKSRIGYKSVLNIIEMQPDGMGLIGEAVKIFDGNENDQHTIEGPKLYKRDGWYYVFAPAGGVKTGWQTVLRSKNIFGPYEYKVVMRQGDSTVNGPHQGAYVDTPSGEEWFLHFQDVYGAGRIIHLQPMSFKDGWPVIGIAKDGNDYGEPVMEYKKPDVTAQWEICEPATSDDFRDNKLGLQWQWNANYENDWYELTGHGIKLKAVNNKDLELCELPNLLLQKWPASEFVAESIFTTSEVKDNDTFGYISQGMEYGAVTFTKENGKFTVKYVTGKQIFGKILCESIDENSKVIGEIDGDVSKIYVRYTVKKDGFIDLNENEKHFPREKVIFSYSTDGINYIEAGNMYAVPGRWVGVKSGVFATTDNDNGGYVIVDKVEYSCIS